MSSTAAPARYTLADAVDRFVVTFASIMLTLAALALAYHYSTDVVAGWHFVTGTVRVVWDTVAGWAAYVAEGR